ncbi:uncharacterized protein LOC120826975 [Gasterosteus aculeatus]
MWKCKLQKNNNRQTIKEKMAKTFGYRRQEIVHKQPSIEDMLTRWPALFQMEEINAEFMRVTTVPLETKFLAQLDKHTSKLLEVIRSKGGRVKELTKATLQVLDETVDITIRRECIFKSLMIYLGEPVHHLIKDCQENEAAMVIVSGNEDIKIVIDRGPQRGAHNSNGCCYVLRAHLCSQHKLSQKSALYP